MKLKLEEKEKKKELKESKKKEIKKVEEKELDNSEDLSESLVIKDYSEDSIPENKDFEDVAHTDDIEFTNDATIETQDDEEEVIDSSIISKFNIISMGYILKIIILWNTIFRIIFYY